MKAWWYNSLAFLLFTVAWLHVPVVFASVKTKNKRSMVRVLLHETSAPADWVLHSPQGFMVADKKQKPHHVVTSTLHLKVSGNNDVRVGDTLYDIKSVVIMPKKDMTEHNSVLYQGLFLVRSQGDKTLLLNCLDLEDYLYSVVRFEGWPGWPLEVNKVFAVACRSYVMAMIHQAKKNKCLYHIKNNNTHQTYGGFHGTARVKDAVDATRGIFLAYEGKPIVAMFDSCCGGVVPAHIASINVERAPYLGRQYACTHCKKCKIYSWQAGRGIQELCTEVEKKYDLQLGVFKNIAVTERDKAGLVKKIALHGSKDSIILTGKQMYSLIKEVRSLHFSIKKSGKKILFTGRGYGHHVGLCQWGACEMVKDGWNYQKVLDFYYPNTTLMCLKKERENTACPDIKVI